MPKIDPRDTALLRALQRAKRPALPLHGVFNELAELWLAANPNSRNKDLAALLGTRPQAIGQWKSGSDPSHRPSWAAVLLLCQLTKRQLIVHPAGVRLARLRPFPHKPTDGPTP